MSNLSTLKQQVEEMQAEIERLEADDREPEIPVGTLCWFWDYGREDGRFGILTSIITDGRGPYVFRAGATGWKHASIANDIPGVMVWQEHDGGPCPVDGDARVIAMGNLGVLWSGHAENCIWRNVTAYAIINKADWML